MSKKKPQRRRRQKKASQEEPAIFDPRLMEKMTADLQRLLSEQEFETIDEAKTFMNEMLVSSMPFPSTATSTPLNTAQDLIYEAWESTGDERLELARAALDISEDCADAWVLLAEEAAGSVHEAMVFFAAGVKAGERALGPDVFEQQAGHFWLVLETRPYMRARSGLAGCLWELGKREQAIGHLQDMLKLNPGDNQGIRYILLSYLLEKGPDSTVDELLQMYSDDGSATWSYSRALFTFRKQGSSPTARKHLQEALRSNSHVPAFLLQSKRLPIKMPDTIGFGDEAEAIVYVAYNSHLWAAEEGAVDWLRRISKAS
jgi:tetratricopeptide (TPR) repeat protein